MKKAITFFLIFIYYSAFSQEILSKDNIEQDSIKIENNFIISLKEGKYCLHNLRGKNIKCNLKKVFVISSNLLQLLDENNSMFYIDSLGVKTEDQHENDMTKFFHNLAYQIDDKNRKIFFKVGKKDTLEDVQNTFFLPKKLKAVVLMNNNNLDYIIKNSFYKNLPQEWVVTRKNKKFGIWNFEKKELILPISYSNIIPYKSYLYLEKNNLVTFYPNIGTKPKYKQLTPYMDYFARFETTDGKKGWVDRKGKEYFDE